MLIERINKLSIVDCYTERPNLPKSLVIEVTNRCNFDCLFCGHHKSTRKNSDIDFELAKSILAQAKTQGMSEVGFYAMGEPTLYSKLTDLVIYAKKIGFDYSYITSNGTAHIQLYKDLINAGLDSIKISLNHSERTEKVITGRSFGNVINSNIMALSQLRTFFDFKLYISTVLTNLTTQLEESIRAQYKNLVDELRFVSVDNQAGYMNVNYLLSVNEMINSCEKIPCAQLYNYVHITAEGYMSCCCMDLNNELIVGDLNRKTLLELWNSKKFIHFRKKHIENNLSHTRCYHCTSNYKESFVSEDEILRIETRIREASI